MASRIVFDRALPHARISLSDDEPLRATIWLSGEIDAECAHALHAEFVWQQLRGHRLVRVDMHGVTFLDSAALGVLVEAHYTWLQMRGTLVLFGVAGATLRILALTGMDRELLHMPPIAARELVGLRA